MLQLAASDGYLTVADRATITVDPDPSIVGASLVVALGAPGPLETGQAETLTATLTDGLGAPIRNFAVRVTVAGANPVTTTLHHERGRRRDASPTRARSRERTCCTRPRSARRSQLDSNFVSVQWIQPASGGAFLTQGWIGAPLDQATAARSASRSCCRPTSRWPRGRSSTARPRRRPTCTSWPRTSAARPARRWRRSTRRVLSNGSYVLQLDGTDNAGNQKTSVVLVTVTGDYKPGRVVVELTDFTVPIAGLPITIGRRYDSLEKDKVGDFGHGWSLAIGHPRLEVNPNFGVSVTLPERAPRDVRPHARIRPDESAPAVRSFSGVFCPVYQGEPGVFGTLTPGGRLPARPLQPEQSGESAPLLLHRRLRARSLRARVYTYTDPYGTAYRMAASGELQVDHGPPGEHADVRAERHHQQRGQERDVRARRAGTDHEGRLRRRSSASDADDYQYAYDAAGDLVDRASCRRTGRLVRSCTTPTTPAPAADDASTRAATRRARRPTTPTGGSRRTRTRSNNVTSYAYNLATRTTTTTFPDTGVRDAGVRRAGAAAERDRPARPHDHARVRREPERDRADERARRGDDRDLRRARQPDVDDRSDSGRPHTTYNDFNLPIDVRGRARPRDDDRIRRPRTCRRASPTSSGRGSRSRTRSRACR